MKPSFSGRGRRSIRVRDFDYTAPGAYFVTICTYQREHIFGNVEEGALVPSRCGRDLAKIWARTVNGGVTPQAHEFVVMPNHVHAIAWLPRRRTTNRWDIRAGVGAVPSVGAQRPQVAPGHLDVGELNFAERRLDELDAAPLRGGLPAKGSLGAAMRSFKANATRAVNLARNSHFRVWQRGYYERIIRDEHELGAVRLYILNNPRNWPGDPMNDPA